jgi:hypothetical protein
MVRSPPPPPPSTPTDAFPCTRVSCVSCVARVAVCAMPIAGAFSAAGLWAGAVKAISHMFLQEYVFAPLLHIATSDEELGTGPSSFLLHHHLMSSVPLHATHTTQHVDESFEAYDPIAPIKQGYILIPITDIVILCLTTFIVNVCVHVYIKKYNIICYVGTCTSVVAGRVPCARWPRLPARFCCRFPSSRPSSSSAPSRYTAPQASTSFSLNV